MPLSEWKTPKKNSTRNIAYASAAVIVVTLLPEFFLMAVFLEKLVVLLAVGLAIFILAASLLHSANAGQVKAEQFQRCALEVNSLRRELLAAPEGVDIADFTNRYDAILKVYNVNHDAVDYDNYRLEHPEEFKDVAKEDVDAARKNVIHVEKATEITTRVILATTLGVLIAVLFSGTLGQRVLEAVQRVIE
ncbi:SLATT domain-containing protein [Cochlodiniinecator piscidefendens]|uniref:SLATT domain-containing protein n=1 Tax=Cochlodiniinecator piscidefendens TaxID=2715756 RepID=UPI001407FBF3|nr:SLATT domain-containing protein [Cochlodiniinecator piscidefendens]